MKHLIFTRFFCISGWTISDEKLLSDELLVPALSHLKKFLIPSLENQTCKDFSLVIMIHKDLEEKRPDVFAQLKAIQTSFPIHLVKYSLVRKFVNALGEKFILETRIDSDDCVFNQAVETLHNKFSKEMDFAFYAFMNGSTMWEDKPYDLHKMTSPTYDGWSSFSVFPSILVNWEKYPFLPMYNHAKFADYAKRLGVTLVRGENHFYDYDIPCAWIWLQHDKNTSLTTCGKNGHMEKTRLDYSRNQILELFGI